MVDFRFWDPTIDLATTQAARGRFSKHAQMLSVRCADAQWSGMR